MSEQEFQQKVLNRLTTIEAQLGERCASRYDSMLKLEKEQLDTDKRLTGLEHLEHQRKGGSAMLAALCGAAGLLGGIIAKFWAAN